MIQGGGLSFSHTRGLAPHCYQISRSIMAPEENLSMGVSFLTKIFLGHSALKGVS